MGDPAAPRPAQTIRARQYGDVEPEQGSGPANIGSREELWTLLTRTRLFLVSYAPLSLIMAARADAATLPTTLWTVLGLAGLADAWRLTHGATRRTATAVTLTEVKDRGGAASGYVATYLLPFVASDPSDYGDILAYIIYVVVLWVVYVRSDLALVNPTLYLFRWKIAEARHAGRNVILVCRELPNENDTLAVSRFLDVYVEKPDGGGS